MNAPIKAHAKRRPPSAAERWVSCPGSSTVAQLYPNESSDASTDGDYAHDVLETCILFGITEPATENEALNDNLTLVLEWVAQTRAAYGPECVVIPEQVFNIPETGEFGTGDITFVSPRVLHIGDYKNGYVLVDHVGNKQMLTYLLGAIAKYGEREQYYITVLQPNASHIEGPIRTHTVTHADVQAYRAEVAWSMANDQVFKAGKHCKKSYCPHRGNCATFIEFAQTDAAAAWHPSDVNAMTDDQLAAALDHADILQGIRDELRKAAMYRMMQQDKQIGGYKVVKGRRDREFKDEQAVKSVLREALQVPDNAMHDTPKFLSVKGIEDLVKSYARKNGLGRGKWKQVWENNIAPHVRENVSGLTLERATDARPAHRRGSEFGSLNPDNQQSGIVI